MNKLFRRWALHSTFVTSSSRCRRQPSAKLSRTGIFMRPPVPAWSGCLRSLGCLEPLSKGSRSKGTMSCEESSLQPWSLQVCQMRTHGNKCVTPTELKEAGPAIPPERRVNASLPWLIVALLQVRRVGKFAVHHQLWKSLCCWTLCFWPCSRGGWVGG